MNRLLHFAVCCLLLSCIFLSCKKEYKSDLPSSVRDTSFDHLAADYKLDTSFSYTAIPPILGPYISQRTFYLPVLMHINTKNLKVEASYGNHSYVELPQNGSRYTLSEDYITVYIQINEIRKEEVFVRVTT